VANSLLNECGDRQFLDLVPKLKRGRVGFPIGTIYPQQGWPIDARARVHTETPRRFLQGSARRKHRIRDAPIVRRNALVNLPPCGSRGSVRILV
jgi:hypothetical protein